MKIASTLLILLVTLCAEAQPFIIWQQCLGGFDEDFAYSIQPTLDGGYIAAGKTISDNGDVSGNHDYFGDNTEDIWVVKVNASGSIEWQRCLGGIGYEQANSIIQDIDGGYVVAGEVSSYDGDVIGYHGSTDMWVVKLDHTGSIQWQQCLGGSSNDEAKSIIQTLDGGYVVAGQTSSTNGDVSENNGSTDFWVVKLDNTGYIQWQKCLGGSDTDVASSIDQTADEGYVVTGKTRSIDGDVSGNHAQYYTDLWVVKLDLMGEIQWQRCFGGTSYEEGTSVSETSDGGYIVAGKAHSIDGDVVGNHSYADMCPPTCHSDMWLIKLNAEGNLIWSKCFGGTDDEYASAVRQTTDGGFIVIGTAESNNGDVSGIHSGWGFEDMWVVKTSATGSIQWSRCLGGIDYEAGYDIQLAPDGGYLLAGVAGTDDPFGNSDVSGIHDYGLQKRDFWIVKLSQGWVNAVENSFNEMALYPNPASEVISIKCDASLLGIAYTVLDITGRPMLEGVISSQALDVSIVDLPAGIYTITVRGEISAERFIKR
jgi:hypothetical protein